MAGAENPPHRIVCTGLTIVKFYFNRQYILSLQIVDFLENLELVAHTRGVVLDVLKPLEAFFLPFVLVDFLPSPSPKATFPNLSHNRPTERS